MTILKIIIQLAPCQTQHNISQESLYSASLTAAKLMTGCKWRTNGHWKCLHSNSPAVPLPTRDLPNVLADLCLLFQVSCVSTWSQLSKLSNVLITWTTLESQPLMLPTSAGTFWQSSSAGLKLTIEKCHNGLKFLGGTISPEGISPRARKFQNFRGKLRYRKSTKAFRLYLSFVKS